MRKTLIVLAIVVCSLLASAQTTTNSSTATSKTVAPDAPHSTALHEGANELGIFVGGGNGFGKRSGTHFVYAGGRWGRVLTGDVGKGWARGNFEFALEVLPIYRVFQAGEDATGFSATPVILKWNFLGTKTVAPFVEIGGGLLFTNNDVPQGTNNLNFTPQGGVGFHIFTAPKRAVTTQIKYLHVSNASLANANSGINASIQFTIGYTWFK